ncbi:MAG: rhamnogalacturonan lyase family protein [Alphaproteobacteria bacterium]
MPADEFSSKIQLAPLIGIKLDQPIKQLAVREVNLAEQAKALLFAYSADSVIDPYVEMFFFPTDTLKLALYALDGRLIWRKDLGPGVIPGGHFTPVQAFDLDGDGVDEIWYVDNVDAEHPLSLKGRRIRRLDANTGRSTGEWEWPWHTWHSRPSYQYRHFILGGHVRSEPVLVTASGTYEDMRLVGWHADMDRRWDVKIAGDDPGARGSHMSPVCDINNDGVDELLWGERCIELDAGKELFCADRDSYRGHSDVIQPTFDRADGRWVIYTCRESDREASPRVATFDDRGNRIWGAVEQGHMDMGWVARIGDGMRHVAMAIRIGGKRAGKEGFFRDGTDQFAWDALTGEPVELSFSAYLTNPVDINGDGYHELYRGYEGHALKDTEILDRHGKLVGRIPGKVVLARRFMDHPGEQLLSYRPDGTVQVWADARAADSPAALERYANGFYRPGEPVQGV